MKPSMELQISLSLVLHANLEHDDTQINPRKFDLSHKDKGMDTKKTTKLGSDVNLQIYPCY